jgi:L-asparaginase
MPQRKSRIAVIGTGGSISMPGRHRLDLYEYSDYARVLEVDELLAMFPEINEVAEAVPIRFRALPSPSIQPVDWLELNDKISEVVRDDPLIEGIVITHGTDTVEETAYFLHLTAKVDVPIVLVAAQRPPNGLGTDAGINLVNALRVASTGEARGMGVMLVMNDEIQCAREVTKTMNSRIHTFQSPDYGSLGQADPVGNVAFYRKPIRRYAPNTEFNVNGMRDLPRVDIVYSYAGVDGVMVEKLVEAGAKGIVIAAMPSGTLPPAQGAALVKASQDGILVVKSRRSNAGRQYIHAKDVDTGILSADNLNPQKARILAMLALTRTNARNEIRRMFLEY